MNPSVGSLWRFKDLSDETPEEIRQNRFIITSRGGGFVEYCLVGEAASTRRVESEFLDLFEPALPPVE